MSIQIAQIKTGIVRNQTQEVIKLLNGSHIEREQRALEMLANMQKQLDQIAVLLLSNG